MYWPLANKEFNLKDLITYIDKINKVITIDDTVLFMYSDHSTQLSEKPKTEGKSKIEGKANTTIQAEF